MPAIQSLAASRNMPHAASDPPGSRMPFPLVRVNIFADGTPGVADPLIRFQATRSHRFVRYSILPNLPG